MTKYVIYVAVNESNGGKCYVGQTCQSLKKRRKRHEYGLEGDTGVFSKAIRKYGPAAFTWFELDYADTVEQANALETYYISYLGSLAPNGYNLDSGGGNKVIHEATKQKMSLAHKGRPKGSFTEEHRKRISEAKRGKSKGPRSEATRKKISESKRGVSTGPHTEEQRRKITEASIKCPVVLQCLDTREVRAFNSQSEAARYLKVRPSNVNDLVHGRVNTAVGWCLYTPPA